MTKKDDKPILTQPPRRLIGAPPSAAIMRITAKEVCKELKKHPNNPTETEESLDDDSEVEKTADETENPEESKTNEDQSSSQATEKKRRKRKKRRLRLTDSGLKAKRKADRREKGGTDQKGIEDDQNMDSDSASVKHEENESQKEEPVKPKEKPKIEDLSPFQLFCDNILRKLLAKDPEGYFANPVSVEDAPDYYKLIKNPMAFAIIQEKIEQDEYQKICDFRSDVDLIVSNAQTYNTEGSIFYLAAEKLSTLAKYYFSEKYLIYLIYALPFGRIVPIERIGIKIPNERKIIQKQLIANGRERDRLNALIKDTETTREIIESAPKSIKNRLSSRRPNCNLVYFDNKNGALALNLLTSNNIYDDEDVDGNDEFSSCSTKKLKLGDLVKPLEHGNPGILYEAFESKINQQYPLISYTNPGPFASFAPQFDSTWATLSKKDSQLLLSCYGDQDNVSDVFSLRQMLENVADDYIDNMFDELTDGEHRKTIAGLEGKELEKPDIINLNPLDEGLEKTGKMIQQLVTVQNNRLSQPPPTSYNYAFIPDQDETHLANNIAQELSKQIIESNVRPKDIVSPKMVHQALGLDADDFEVLSEFLDV